MKRSCKLRPGLWDLVVAAVVVAMALGCAGAVYGGQDGGALTASVWIDGRAVETIRLDDSGHRVYQNGGYTLEADFSPAGVQVTESDCPNQDCVHTGTVSRPGQSIVCLPARISIQLAGDGGVDVVIG